MKPPLLDIATWIVILASGILLVVALVAAARRRKKPLPRSEHHELALSELWHWLREPHIVQTCYKAGAFDELGRMRILQTLDLMTESQLDALMYKMLQFRDVREACAIFISQTGHHGRKEARDFLSGFAERMRAAERNADEWQKTARKAKLPRSVSS